MPLSETFNLGDVGKLSNAQGDLALRSRKTKVFPAAPINAVTCLEAKKQ